jgi:two-component system, OmpR family, phosphate regulon sensor histidine kinase PhoR
VGDLEARLEEMADATNLAVHELRAPLGVASGYTSMLLDGSLGPGPEEWLMTLKLIAEKLSVASELVNNMLILARLNSETQSPRQEDVDLVPIAKAAGGRAQSRADLVGGRIEIENEDAEVHARCDEGMAATIVDNLVSNALLYGGDAPKVTIRVSRSPGPQISVTDRGRGIDEGLQRQVFERFFRVTDRGTIQGSGLGLYLSDKLAKQQGGTLSLDWSEVGQGSTFSLRLPSV